MKRREVILLSVITTALLLGIYVLGLWIPEEAVQGNYLEASRPPLAAHPFGTDALGRDLLLRTLKGMSVSMTVGLAATALGGIIALVLGMAGVLRCKWIDGGINWCIDLVMSVPHTILIILISFVTGRGWKGLLIGIGATHWCSLARLIRGEVLQLRSKPYVEVSRRLGKSGFWIMRHHVLPHLLPQFFVGCLLMLPHAILHEASISFLGYGLPPEQPAIGMILSESMRYLSAGMWWPAVLPGLSMVLVVLLIDRLGAGLLAILEPSKVQESGESMGSAKEALPMKQNRGEALYTNQTDSEALLTIQEVSVSFRMYGQGVTQTELPTISHMDLTVFPGEIVAVAGASGAGKSLLASAILGLLPENAVFSGRICFQGEELTPARQAELRGTKIAYVPQSVSYLDPRMKVGRQVRGHAGAVSEGEMKKVFQRLELPENVEKLYPYQLSGGMARRILVATALVGETSLILADEPTPGMSRQQAKEALAMFREMADEGKAVLLITHDIDLAVEVADRVAILNAGTMVETVSVSDFMAGPQALRHPYSKALWYALPQNGFAAAEEICHSKDFAAAEKTQLPCSGDGDPM